MFSVHVSGLQMSSLLITNLLGVHFLLLFQPLNFFEHLGKWGVFKQLLMTACNESSSSLRSGLSQSEGMSCHSHPLALRGPRLIQHASLLLTGRLLGMLSSIAAPWDSNKCWLLCFEELGQFMNVMARATSRCYKCIPPSSDCVTVSKMDWY